jgi:hypothetical protein
VPLFTAHQGKRYRATVSLGWIERLASNEIIAQKFRDLGFSDVQVVGRGNRRSVKALWSKEDATGEIPPRIKSIDEVDT